MVGVGAIKSLVVLPKPCVWNSGCALPKSAMVCPGDRAAHWFICGENVLKYEIRWILSDNKVVKGQSVSCSLITIPKLVS